MKETNAEVLCTNCCAGTSTNLTQSVAESPAYSSVHLTSMSEVEVHSSVEQRIIIKFLTKEGVKPSEICERLKKQFGEETLSDISVYKWSKAFKDGRERVENEPHSRRPKTSTTEQIADRVNALIQNDRRITVRDIASTLNISVGGVDCIIIDQLQYRKVCARWIPRMLTDQHKQTRLQVAHSLLARYEEEGYSGVKLDKKRPKLRNNYSFHIFL